MLGNLFNKSNEENDQKAQREIRTALMELSYIRDALEGEIVDARSKEQLYLHKKELIQGSRKSLEFAKKQIESKKKEQKQIEAKCRKLELKLSELNEKLQEDINYQGKIESSIQHDRQTLVEKEEHLKIREAELAKVKNIYNDVSDELNTIESEKRVIDEKISQLEEREQALKLQAHELESKKAKVKIGLVAKDERKNDLAKRVDKLNELIAKLSDQVDTESLEYETLGQTRSELENQLKAAQTRKVELESRLEKLNQEVEKYRNEIAQMNDQVEGQLQNHLELNSQVNSFNTDIQDLKSQIDNISRKSEELSFELSELNSRRENLKAQKCELLEQAENARSNKQQVENELINVANEYALLEEDFNRLNESFNSKENTYQAQLKELTSLKSRSKDLDTQRSLLIEKSSQLERLNGRNQKLIKVVQQSIVAKREKVHQLELEVGELTQQKLQITASLTTLDEDRIHSNSIMKKKLVEYDKLQSEIDRLNQTHEKNKVELAQTKDSIANYKRDISSLENEIIDIKSSIAQFQREQFEEENLLANFQANVEERKNQKELLVEQLSIAQTNVNSLKERKSQKELSLDQVCQKEFEIQQELIILSNQEKVFHRELASLNDQLGEIKQRTQDLMVKREESESLLVQMQDLIVVKKNDCEEYQVQLKQIEDSIFSNQDEYRGLSIELEKLSARERRLVKLLNAKDDDLNSLKTNIDELKQQELYSQQQIQELEEQTVHMEALIAQLDNESVLLEESRERLGKVLSGVQRKFNSLKSVYENKLGQFNSDKESLRETINEVQQGKYAIQGIERRIEELTTSQVDVKPMDRNEKASANAEDVVVESQASQYIAAMRETCAESNVILHLDTDWLDELESENVALLNYHAASLYTKAIKAMGAQRVSLEIFQLENFNNNHFVMRITPDQIDDVRAIKDVFSKSSTILKRRVPNLAPKVAYKARVEDGVISRIDIVVKFEEIEHKKSHHPWRPINQSSLIS